MTVRGIDVSEYQAGLSLAAAKQAGAGFVIARATRGPDLYLDPEYRRFRDEAKDLRLPFAAYHFMGDRPASQEADLIAATVGPKTPIMLDCEPSSRWHSRPTYPAALALRHALEALGRRVTMLYLPHWWWEQIGKPDLSRDGWPALVSSNYVGAAGQHRAPLTAGPLGNAGWLPYGGVTPTLWQWSSDVGIPGYTGNTVDGDAYDGPPALLESSGLFRVWGAASSTVGQVSTSQNGWQVLETSRTTGPLPRLRLLELPGTGRHVYVRDGSAGFLLGHFALWWNDRVSPLGGGTWDEWGWAVRPVRGQTSGYSNHASGTAIDLDATEFPRGVPILSRFKAYQVARIHARLLLYRGALGWGGDYQRTVDGMHVEVTTGTTLSKCETVARALLDTKRGKALCDANPGLRAVVLS